MTPKKITVVGGQRILPYPSLLEISTQVKYDTFHMRELSVPLDYFYTPCSEPKVKHAQILDGV